MGHGVASACLALFVLTRHCVGAIHTPYLTPGFQFDYDSPGAQLSIPVTGQCERIHLEWNRETNNTGPSPVAPYSLQVYTSTSPTPFVVYAGFGPTFDWDVPFSPNTQYQICMFDVNGISGGCQATYTVIQNTTTNTPTCQNVTAPSALSVEGEVPLGKLWNYSYIDQCTSLSVTPQSGRPPFTLTIAPDFHPPYNITSSSMDSISWQVSLPVGFRFFLSLTSSDGLMWANGPMRVGDLGPTDCLSPGSLGKQMVVDITVGTTLGGIVLGVLMGIAGCLVFFRTKDHRRAPSQAFRDYVPRNDSPGRPQTLRSTSFTTPSTHRERTSYSIASTPLTMLMPLTTTPQSQLHELPPISDSPDLEHSTGTSTPPRRAFTRSRNILTLVEPYSVAPSEVSLSPVRSQFPADVKRRLHESSSFSRDDTTTITPSSSRRLSVASRAPTYVPGPGIFGHATYAIDEIENPEQPPEYTRHTDDASLTPPATSSNRF